MGFDIPPSYDAFRHGIEPVDLWSSGFICLNLPIALLPYIAGALEPLKWPDVYNGNIENTGLMIRQVETFLAELGSERQRCPGAAGNGDAGQDGGTGQGFEVFEDCGDCEMTNCSVPFGALRWNSEGQLEFRYCGEWYPVEGTGPAVEVVNDGDVTIPDDPPGNLTDATACSMAIRLADLTYEIVQAAFASLGVDGDPWEFYDDMNQAFPSIDLAFTDLVNMYFTAATLQVAGKENATENPDMAQLLRCRFQPLITPNNQGIAGEEYSKCINATNSATFEFFTSEDHGGFAPFMRGMWNAAIQSIGSSDAKKVTYFAQPTAGDDCSCPGLPVSEGGATQPTASGWYWSPWKEIDFSCIGGFNGTKIPIWHAHEHDVYGIALKFVRTGGAPWLEGKRTSEGGSIPGFSYDEYWFGTVTDHLALNYWYCQVDNTVWTAELDGQLENDQRPGDNTGQYSGTVASPVSAAGTLTYGTVTGIASGGEEVSVEGVLYVRYLRNINSASHQ